MQKTKEIEKNPNSKSWIYNLIEIQLKSFFDDKHQV